jgi:Tfp pilus assembly protein PilZ
MDESEARRFSRLRVELTARLAFLDAERDHRTGSPIYRVMTVRTVDVSDGGLCVRAEEGVTTGRRVVLELDLPDGRTYDLAGMVVWLEPQAIDASAHMGIAFSDLRFGLVHTVG